MPNLQKRITGILMNPKAEWSAIAAEPDDAAALYRDYIVWLAAVPAVCMLLGLTIIGIPVLGRFGLSIAVRSAVAMFVSALVAPLVMALVLENLAPRFQSTGSTARALKLVAYASTPWWLAGVFYLVMMLSPLSLIAAIYGIYLFYLGLPVVMKTPHEQVVPFMVVAALVVVVLNIVLRFIVGAFGVPMYGY